MNANLNKSTNISVAKDSIGSQSNVRLFDPALFDSLVTHLHFQNKKLKGEVLSIYDYMKNMDSEALKAVSVSGDGFVIIDKDSALKRIDANSWSEFLLNSKVAGILPYSERVKWEEQVRTLEDIQEFTPECVNAQVRHLFANANETMSNRVSDIFSRLSSEHVTNSSFGFNDKMIIANCDHLSAENNSYALHDLRCVLSFLRNEIDLPDLSSTGMILSIVMSETGKWHEFDGGAIRIKGFKALTVHLEIHEDMADKLNRFLAFKHPNCLANGVRTKVRKGYKLVPYEKMLANDVREVFKTISVRHPKVRNPHYDRSKDPRVIVSNQNIYKLSVSVGKLKKEKKSLYEEFMQLACLLFGDVDSLDYYAEWLIDFNPQSLIDHICRVGTMPDVVSHQLYESTELIREKMAEYVEIYEDDICCEPSAGRGMLASLLPKERLTCIEINRLNCLVLLSKDYQVKQRDFLAYSKSTSDRYDLFLMNPPYYRGAYNDHLDAAIKLLNPGGRVTAVVYDSFDKKRFTDKGYEVIEHERINEKFEGCGKVNVAIVTIKS